MGQSSHSHVEWSSGSTVSEKEPGLHSTHDPNRSRYVPRGHSSMEGLTDGAELEGAELEGTLDGIELGAPEGWPVGCLEG